MDSISRQCGDWYGRARAWLARAEGWQIALVLLVALLALPPLVPIIALAALVAAFALFARAWLHEFTYLMRLGDDAFPGHNDKLIWAMLLIVLAPVGVWLFRTYREAHWAEVKPGHADGIPY